MLPAQVTSTTMKLLLLLLLRVLCLCLLSVSGSTSAASNGEVQVDEGSDVVLLCSFGQTDLTYVVFDWKKDDQNEVFLYDAGVHYNNGRGGQDPQFKGRVSHFHHELKHGNASIKIRDTKAQDSGDYSCIFPNLDEKGEHTCHIKLVVGASPEPYVTALNYTKDQALLQCVVRGASPKPTVEWRDSSGNVVPAKEPQVTERGGSYDIILQTTVTKTDRYRCISTQDEIKHQVHAETEVYISGPDSQSGDSSTTWKAVAAVLSVLFVAVLVLVSLLYVKFNKLQHSLQEMKAGRRPSTESPSEKDQLRE